MEGKEFRNLLVASWRDLHDPSALWELGVVVAAIGLGWIIARLLVPRLDDVDARWRVGAGGLKRVLLPLCALLLALLGRYALRQFTPVHLLNVAVPLLFSWVLVRCAVYVLRLLFSGSWVQSFERLIFWVVWLGFALHVSGLAPELLQFLDDLGFHIGKQRVSMLLILQAMLSVAITLLLAMWLARLVEGQIMGADGVDINVRVMFAKLSRAALVLAAFLIALPAVGVDLTLLSVFGGALGVGLGFGLQKIASNYVSGFIILLDRSIRMGDMVTVDNRYGKLIKMTARYVVIRALDGTEAIIPNDTIITSTVVNNTYTDTRLRLPVAVQITYQSDLDRAMSLMLECARAHERVLADPEPKVLLKALADSGIELELGVWLSDPEKGQGNLRSDLLLAIRRGFSANGIDLPYPQREVRIVPGSAAITAPPV